MEKGYLRRGNYMKKSEGIYKEKMGTVWNKKRDIYKDRKKIIQKSNQLTNKFILFSDKLLQNIIYITNYILFSKTLCLILEEVWLAKI